MKCGGAISVKGPRRRHSSSSGYGHFHWRELADIFTRPPEAIETPKTPRRDGAEYFHGTGLDSSLRRPTFSSCSLRHAARLHDSWRKAHRPCADDIHLPQLRADVSGA